MEDPDATSPEPDADSPPDRDVVSVPPRTTSDASEESGPARQRDRDAAGQVIALARAVAGPVRAAGAAVAARRGVPLALAGAVVATLAWLGERDSAWGFPMLLAGLVMIGVGVIGPRLSGSVDVRWGEDGAFLQLTSTVAPPGQRRTAPKGRSLPAGAVGDPDATRGRDDHDAVTTDGDLLPPTEIEGSAETIDFNVEALKRELERPLSAESRGAADSTS